MITFDCHRYQATSSTEVPSTSLDDCSGKPGTWNWNDAMHEQIDTALANGSVVLLTCEVPSRQHYGNLENSHYALQDRYFRVSTPNHGWHFTKHPG